MLHNGRYPKKLGSIKIWTWAVKKKDIISCNTEASQTITCNIAPKCSPGTVETEDAVMDE